MGMLALRAGACAVPGFPGRISDARWHPRPWPCDMQSPGGQIDVAPSQRHQLRGSETGAVGDQDGCDVPCPDRFCLAASMSPSTSRSVRYSYFDEAANIINP